METQINTPTIKIRFTRLLGGRLRLTADFAQGTDPATILSLIAGVLEQASAELLPKSNVAASETEVQP